MKTGEVEKYVCMVMWRNDDISQPWRTLGFFNDSFGDRSVASFSDIFILLGKYWEWTGIQHQTNWYIHIQLIYLRYGWQPNRFPLECACSEKFPIDHAISCKVGSFIHMRHNGLLNITADLLSNVCKDVEKETLLQLLTTGTEELRADRHRRAAPWHSGLRLLATYAKGIHGCEGFLSLRPKLQEPESRRHYKNNGGQEEKEVRGTNIEQRILIYSHLAGGWAKKPRDFSKDLQSWYPIKPRYH